MAEISFFIHDFTFSYSKVSFQKEIQEHYIKKVVHIKENKNMI